MITTIILSVAVVFLLLNAIAQHGAICGLRSKYKALYSCTHDHIDDLSKRVDRYAVLGADHFKVLEKHLGIKHNVTYAGDTKTVITRNNEFTFEKIDTGAEAKPLYKGDGSSIKAKK